MLTKTFDRKSSDIIIGLGFSSKYEIAEIVTSIKFQLLATKVGNTIKTVGTYWILDSIQWQGYWGTARHSTWPRSTYRGATLTLLQHKTGTIPY